MSCMATGPRDNRHTSSPPRSCCHAWPQATTDKHTVIYRNVAIRKKKENIEEDTGTQSLNLYLWDEEAEEKRRTKNEGDRNEESEGRDGSGLSQRFSAPQGLGDNENFSCSFCWRSLLE